MISSGIFVVDCLAIVGRPVASAVFCCDQHLKFSVAHLIRRHLKAAPTSRRIVFQQGRLEFFAVRGCGRIITTGTGEQDLMIAKSMLKTRCLAGLLAMTVGCYGFAVQAEEAGKGNAAGSGWSAEVAPDGAGSITLDANQTAMIDKVNGYFNELKTLQGRFVQTDANGETMKGKFKMKRPGMFRFDYARPSRQVIISDGTYLAIQDHDLNNEDRVALDQTPFRVLLREDVNLLRDSLITEVQENDTSILLALQDKSPDTPGRIRLVLSKDPALALKEWITNDAQGLETRVEVSDLERDADIDASEFVIKAPGNPFPQ